MRLTLAALTYFLTNTFIVAGIIALTEYRSLFRLWKEYYSWSFPFYFVGAGVAWVCHRVAASFGWQAAMIALPVAYIVYWAYRFCLGRLDDEARHATEYGCPAPTQD